MFLVFSWFSRQGVWERLPQSHHRGGEKDCPGQSNINLKDILKHRKNCETALTPGIPGLWNLAATNGESNSMSNISVSPQLMSPISTV